MKTIHICHDNCLHCLEYPNKEYENCSTFKWRKGIIKECDAFEEVFVFSYNPATYYDDIKTK